MVLLLLQEVCGPGAGGGGSPPEDQDGADAAPYQEPEGVHVTLQESTQPPQPAQPPQPPQPVQSEKAPRLEAASNTALHHVFTTSPSIWK